MFAQMAQPPQQSPQGIPPQIMQMLMQQQGGAQRPPMPPQGQSPQIQGMPQGSAPSSPQMNSPSGAGGNIPPQILQMLMAELQKQAPQQLAAQGRGGDNMVAHLTPGEMMVPPQVQTHKVLATLDKAYKEKGVKPQQFTAGSPQSSTNPKTGMPEYNFLSAFLPAALGIAGAVAAPELLPATLGSPALLAALGSGIGTTAGGVVAGEKPQQAALAGLGSGLGGYALGGIGGGAAAGNEGISSQLSNADPNLANPLSQNAANMGSNAAMLPPKLLGSQTLGNYAHNLNPMGMAGSALGGYIGGQLGAPHTPIAQNEANKMLNTPLTPFSQLPSAQQQLGMNNSPQPRPNFNNYNPATNYPASYNFGV